jgi:hypothetical protein
MRLVKRKPLQEVVVLPKELALWGPLLHPVAGSATLLRTALGNA